MFMAEMSSPSMSCSWRISAGGSKLLPREAIEPAVFVARKGQEVVEGGALAGLLDTRAVPVGEVRSYRT